MAREHIPDDNIEDYEMQTQLDEHLHHGNTGDDNTATGSSLEAGDHLASTPESSQKTNYRLQYTLTGHKKSISSVKFSPSGQYLASSSADKFVKLWDVETGHLVRTFEGHLQGISDVAWSSDSQLLASASDDKTVRVWRVDQVSDNEP